MEPKETQQQYSTHNTSTTLLPISWLQPANASGGSQMYSRSAPSEVLTSTSEPAKKKRGRPRKHESLEQAMAARQLSLGGGSGATLFGSSNKSQLTALGNAGQGITPLIIIVAAGEDVSQRIMMFLQQSKLEMCILSASGTISYASLYQPGTSSTAYEGRFQIISLSGSYVRSETGKMTGRLTVSLSTADGQVIGGGVGGPLMAAGPVQVIIGAFTVDDKVDSSPGATGDAPGSKLPSPVGGTSASNVGVRSGFETRGNRQSFRGSNFMWQPRSTGFDLTGKTGHGAYQPPPPESKDSDL